jgi:hypothetical protein
MIAEGIEPERAERLLKASVDAVAWCELMFGFDDNDPEWNLRSYQKEQIRCSAQRMVVREGRRAGKTFAMVIKLLYLVFHKKVYRGKDAHGRNIEAGPQVMIVTPYQSQISNIFDEMEKILKRNKDLVGDVTTGTGGNLYVKTPFHRMEFKNGAKISGFVSGVGTKADGSGGGVIRGQNAHIIYLDEMDMIPDEVLDKAVMPIMLTKKDVMIIATSTPIGKRGRFYSWCLEDPTFKEDYLPSTVLPQWEANKDMFENENSTEAFAAEYMAAFIEGGYGVFKPSYVAVARKGYSYANTMSRGWWRQFAGVLDSDKLIKVMGIDWNKNAGTEFVVVAYDPASHRWFVVEAVNITAGEFSSMRWKEEVIRLNYKWKPDYIYADEGYGHTIIEDLKIIAFNVRVKQEKTHQDRQTEKLIERLVAFNFSQRVEMTSPIDGSPIVKSGKDFLVENAVRVFEQESIWYPEEDEALRKQLMNYVVLRRTPTTNKPIYGPEKKEIGDHRLDALMLALAGIQLENGLYTKGAMITSKPKLYTKTHLDNRDEKRTAVHRLTPGGSLREFLEKQTVAAPVALEILEVMRSGETPAQAMARVKGSEPRVTGRRSPGEEKNWSEMTVHEYYNRRAGVSASAFDTDREDEARAELESKFSKPRIAHRNRRARVRNSFKSRKKR